ncbi:MAG: LysE family translocator [Pseudomonadota bacterium]
MSVETWLIFVAACAGLTLLPGPSVFVVLSQTLSNGRSAGLRAVLGTVVSGMIVIPASYAGIGAVLAASGYALQTLKWAGAAYLVWLGVSQCLKATKDASTQGPPSLRGKGFSAGFLTGVLNPKAIVFYAAFLSQFISPDAPLMGQFGVLMITALAVILVILSGYVFAVAAARRVFSSPRARRRLEGLGGVALIGGGAGLALRGP